MDWDKDGKLDILSGCYWSDGADAAHIELLAGRGKMDFAKAVSLKTESGVPLTNVKHKRDRNDPNDVEWRNICTHQYAVDYDDDGDLDLVVGCIGAELFFVENSGGKGKPILTDKPEQLSISVPGAHGGPHLVDWDGDGDLDMLTGSGNGGAYLSENVGTRKAPKWSDFVQLVPPSTAGLQTTDGGGEIVPSRATRVWVTDWNGDGKLDLLLGDNCTVSNRKPGISAEEFKKLKAEYDKEFSEAATAYSAVVQKYTKQQQEDGEVSAELQAELQKASTAYSQVYQKKNRFVDERRTGFVWLFVQK